ncbi:sensor histidine kinase [Roseateles sp. NT4]|uniref:sensor histidine kinase n=1 Tax=Roseateles sp. NT4 TaxID=3453715 RepID=UPI003EEA01EB
MNTQRPPFDATGSTQVMRVLPGLQSSLARSHVAWRGIADESGPEAAERASALWRQAVHDLRGKLGVVAGVTAMLQKPVGEARRFELMAMLDRNVTGLRELLNGVADLARLDAMQEQPVIRDVDIAATLGETCNSLRIMASVRGLQLEFKGPANLAARTDPLMVARIAQNLVLNAIQYTQARSVMLTCGRCAGAESEHWYFEVGDTPFAPGGNDLMEPASLLPTAAGQTSGEGIGLSIVSRLCGLLGGTMQFVPADGAGRMTRIELPARGDGALETLMIPVAGRVGTVAAGPWASAGRQGIQNRRGP